MLPRALTAREQRSQSLGPLNAYITASMDPGLEEDRPPARKCGAHGTSLDVKGGDSWTRESRLALTPGDRAPEGR